MSGKSVQKHTKTAKTAHGSAASLSAAAGRLGIKVEVLQHCKGLGWSCFKSNNGVDCDVFVNMLADRPDILEQFGESVNEKIEKALLVRERRLDLADKRARANRVHIHVDEVKRECVRFVNAMKSRQIALETNVIVAATVDLKLNNEQAARLREILVAENREALNAMARGEWFKE